MLVGTGSKGQFLVGVQTLHAQQVVKSGSISASIAHQPSNARPDKCASCINQQSFDIWAKSTVQGCLPCVGVDLGAPQTILLAASLLGHVTPVIQLEHM